MAGIVCVYAGALGLLGFLVRSLAPSHPSVVFFVALAGCVLCTVWGVAAIAGHRSRAGVILTLIPVALVLLYQALHAWWPAPTQSPPPASVAALLTGTFALTVGLLLYLVHGERPPDTRPTPTPRRDPAPASSAVLAQRTGSPSDTRHPQGKGIPS